MTAALALVWTAALGAAPPSTAPPDSVATCPDGVVLDASDLVGVVAIHDLARLVPFLDAVSVDGYDAQPLAGWGTPRPLRVLVDGVPTASTVSVEPLGLEPLPVAVGEIRRVVACPGPGLAGGVWGGPWIDVETAPPGRAYAAGLYANETGDPGPDFYRDASRPNVDRWGPDAEAGLGASTGGAEAWVVGRLHRILPTDTSIARRIREVSVPGPNPERLGTVAALAFRRGGVGARVGGHRASDLPFLPLAGREVPADRRAVQAGLRLRQRGVRAHLHAASLRLERPLGSRLAFDGPDWSEQRADAAVSLSLPAVTVGAQGDATRASAPGLAGTVATGRAWAHFRRGTERGSVSLAVQTTASDAGVFVGGTATGRRQWGRTRALVTVALDRPPPGVEAWLSRGYAGLGGAVSAGVRGPEAPTVALARLGVSGQALGVTASASADVQWGRGAAPVYDWSRDGTAVAGSVVFEEARGTAGGVRARVQWRGGVWGVTAWGRVHGALGGTDAHRDAWARLPQSTADVRVTLRPDARLSLWASARARSGARWEGVPDPGVPPVLLADLGLVKRAWGDRLAVTVVGRNVLDAPERTHPLGAVLAPRLFVRAALRL